MSRHGSDPNNGRNITVWQRYTIRSSYTVLSICGRTAPPRRHAGIGAAIDRARPLAHSLLALALIAGLWGCNAAGSGQSVTQRVMAISDRAADGTPKVYAVPLQATESVTLTLTSSDPGTTAELRDADGTTRLRLAVPDQPGGMPLDAPGHGATSNLRSPADGRYELVIRAPQGARYSARVEVSSPIALLVRADRERYLTTDQIRISAQLYDETTPLPSATIRSRLWVGDKDLGELVFRREGEAFVATAAPPLPAGAARTLVIAESGLVRREVELLLPIAEATAQIGDVRGERLADLDGDGRADTLQIIVALQVKRAGSFALAGQLSTPAGQVVATTEYNSAIQAALGLGLPELAPGEGEVTLDFALSQIVAQGSDGPYRLRLSLADIGQGGAEVDQRPEAHTTRAYRVEELR